MSKFDNSNKDKFEAVEKNLATPSDEEATIAYPNITNSNIQENSLDKTATYNKFDAVEKKFNPTSDEEETITYTNPNSNNINDKSLDVTQTYNKFEVVEKDLVKPNDEEATVAYSDNNIKNNEAINNEKLEPLKKKTVKTKLKKKSKRKKNSLNKKDIPKDRHQQEELKEPISDDYEETTNILLSAEDTTNIVPNEIEPDNTVSVISDDLTSSSKDKITKIIAISSVVLFVVFVLLIINNNNKEKKIAELKERKKRELIIEKVSNAHFMGVNEFKLQKWDSAIDYFDKALALKPNHTEAKKYKKISVLEKKNEVIFKNVRQLMIDENYPAALVQIKKIDKISSYHETSKKLKVKIEKRLAILEKEKKEKEEEKKELQEEERKEEKNQALNLILELKKILF